MLLERRKMKEKVFRLSIMFSVSTPASELISISFARQELAPAKRAAMEAAPHPQPKSKIRLPLTRLGKLRMCRTRA